MAKPGKFDPRWRELELTEHQAKVVDALEESGGHRTEAGKALGLPQDRISHVVAKLNRRLERQLARTDANEHLDPSHTPDGFAIKGISSLHRQVDPETGEKVLFWKKTDRDKEAAFRAMLNAIEQAGEGIEPYQRVKAPKGTRPELLTLYTITDYHLGMYAWAEETGDDWDSQIAETTLIESMVELIDRSPDSETAIFLQLGDFLHWDGLLAVTPTSKHVLDADTRYDKLADLAIRLMMQSVELLLRKHKRVLVVAAEGNHDMAGSVWLRKAMKLAFRKNPRVEVNDTPFPFYAFLHGETMIAAHHGHLQKKQNLAELFASEPRFRRMWGQARKTYIHTGHLHHEHVLELGGAIVTQHPTLAGRDAHSARGFSHSRRAAHAINYDDKGNEHSRATVSVGPMSDDEEDSAA